MPKITLITGRENVSNKLENENLIRRFLFGEMSERETSEIEEKFITDAELFASIKAVEDELIEKYVRGWMDPAESGKFEQRFLTTNKRRDRVEFSRQLIKRISETGDQKTVELKKNESIVEGTPTVFERLAAVFLNPRVLAAGAFVLAIALIGSWVLYQNLNAGKTEIAKKDEANVNAEPTPEIVAPEQTVSPAPPDNNNSEDLSNVPADLPPSNSNGNTASPQKEPLETSTPKKESVKKTEPKPFIALFPGTLRSGGRNSVLKLPTEAKTATIQLNLKNAPYKTFQVRLTDADGNVLFELENLTPRNSKVVFGIPTAKLSRGDYTIKLNGKNSSVENESVADYQFRVDK